MTASYTVLIIILLEIILTIIYTIITPKDKKVGYLDYKSLVKGWVERAFLTYSLLSGYPHTLTLFGALKLGTRLKHSENTSTDEGKKQEEIYNNYYLVGNLISVSLSIIYVNLIKNIA
ncbi:MAG: hypothetical protein FGM14_16695 [Flavobacteriales bacterium]|nr:hypothetical protein [Flavobacteriales bacterium]